MKYESTARRRIVQMTQLENATIVEKAQMTRTEFTAGGQRYEVDPPLEFRVQYDSSDQVYDVTGDFRIEFAVESASELGTALDSMLEAR